MDDRKPYRQAVEVRGHIIDSMILPRILDELTDIGADYEIQQIEIGRHKSDTSYARIEVAATSEEHLQATLTAVQRHGASIIGTEEAALSPAPADGVFPEEFYSTTNLDTLIRSDGRWVPVRYPEMDCGIVVRAGQPECIPLNEVRRGDQIVVGHQGVRLVPLERSRQPSPAFGFMGSAVSSEKPKALIIREIAGWMRQAHQRGRKIVVVSGPAVIHTGSREYLSRLIETRAIDYLFAGNALATHDIELALFGTSLGVSLTGGPAIETGHEHHLRAINRIRAAGGIRRAVEKGILNEGVMYSCVKHEVDFLLAGSIRDDGPLPEVITDVLEAQAAMRERIRGGVEIAILLSTMLHSIAVGNLLPATAATVCIDINPSVLTKLMDRGSFQTLGLVMDVGSFLRELCEALDDAELPAGAQA